LSHFKNAPEIRQDKVLQGSAISTDSYYSAQGRTDVNFNDNNKDLFKYIAQVQPDALFFEMENFQLFHLARLCNKTIRAAAAAVPLANRE
jgi:uridine phosphorylase